MGELYGKKWNAVIFYVERVKNETSRKLILYIRLWLSELHPLTCVPSTVTPHNERKPML